MGKKGKWMQRLVAVALSVILISSSGCSRKATANLELRLQPEDVQAGVPQAFKFLLINKTQHAVTLPRDPSVTSSNSCGDTYYGRVGLTLHFVPLEPHPSGSSIMECGYSMRGWPPVLDRVKDWKTLKPGESLVFEASKAQLEYEDRLAGTYEFEAIYDPPLLEPEDGNTLRRVGIDTPSGDIESTHITFVKRAKD